MTNPLGRGGARHAPHCWGHLAVMDPVSGRGSAPDHSSGLVGTTAPCQGSGQSQSTPATATKRPGTAVHSLLGDTKRPARNCPDSRGLHLTSAGQILPQALQLSLALGPTDTHRNMATSPTTSPGQLSDGKRPVEMTNYFVLIKSMVPGVERSPAAIRDHLQASLQQPRRDRADPSCRPPSPPSTAGRHVGVQPADPSLSPARPLLSSCPHVGAHSSCVTMRQQQSPGKNHILLSPPLHWWGGFLKLFPN